MTKLASDLRRSGKHHNAASDFVAARDRRFGRGQCVRDSRHASLIRCQCSFLEFCKASLLLAGVSAAEEAVWDCDCESQTAWCSRCEARYLIRHELGRAMRHLVRYEHVFDHL